MSQNTGKVVYDPVPPYDLDDLEAGAAQPQPPASNRQANDGDQQAAAEVLTTPQDRRRGKLTEKECCAYAFAYFALSITGIVLVVLIIAWFNYLGRQK
jgi:hypothetical protein